MSRPLILDLDGSVLPLEGEQRIPLRHYEESIRFGCRMRDLQRIAEELAPHLASASDAPAFLGSGDFHHLTYSLIARLHTRGLRLQVVVFDNHPDNMRYPFGIHCGSWVAHAARLPFVERVHVAGITSSDVEGLHAFENNLAALRSGKVVYWCIGRRLSMLRRLGARHSRSFSTSVEMLEALSLELSTWAGGLYVSVDKDVLAAGEVQTNWDQGLMRLDELEPAIRALQPRILGSDVVGDVSSYRYRSRWKRLLSAIDRQPEIAPSALPAWQQAHRQVNSRLAALLNRGSG